MSQQSRVSHSELLAKEILDQYFTGFKKLDNVRPDWLEGLEIDRLYSTLGLAIEFQGDQHYRVVPGLHKEPQDFQRQIDIDTRKRQLIEKMGMRLYSINILDLDRFRIKILIKQMAEDGKKYASSQGNLDDLTKLKKIHWNEPDPLLMTKADRFSRVRKTYFNKSKKNWWRKLLGI